ncbi:MAG TPA: hypothetical protein DCF63_04660, partial [Planctomycetaceae bacterium]|nr:hypothetical protein [Planctomycetaceae bacterium]
MSQRSIVQTATTQPMAGVVALDQQLQAGATVEGPGLISTLAADIDLAELVRDFAIGLPAKAAQLDALLAAGDLAGIRSLAHQIKGAGGGYGYPAITDAAFQLEKVASEQSDFQKVEMHIRELQQLCAAAELGARQPTESICPEICTLSSKQAGPNGDNGLSVLLVDDDPSVLELMDAVLRPLNVVVRLAKSGQEALDAITCDPPDIVLLDYNIPVVDGLGVLKTIRSNAKFQAIEIIFATVHSDDSLITACFSAGANDYIRKPFNRTELLARVRAAISRRQTEKLLKSVARIDYLTGAPNRLALIEQTAHLVAKAKNFNKPFAVLFLDCDRFRAINAALGHQGGDELL